MQGENNPRYSGKVTVLCDYCKKPIQKKPSLLKHANAEGKTHNFCNIECYSKFMLQKIEKTDNIKQLQKEAISIQEFINNM